MKNKVKREIFSKYVHGNFTLDDRKYIEKTFEDEEKKEEVQEILESDWIGINKKDDFEKRDLSHVFYKLYYDITRQTLQKRNSVVRKIWENSTKIAATILLPLVLTYAIYVNREIAQIDKEISYAEIVSPLGTRVSFNLPDGSKGWLNSGSSLKYPTAFTNTRDVELNGEAFFDIIKNEKKSFNVKTNYINVTVLGTKFNVSAYEGENTAVVLESGKVNLNRVGSNKVVEMNPDDRVVYNYEKKAIQRSKVNSNKYSSWKEGKLEFRNDQIEEVAKRLNRWYNVDIIIENHVRSDYLLRATFEDEEIEEVMKLLKLTFPIEYEIEERKKDPQGKFIKRKIRINFKQPV